MKEQEGCEREFAFIFLKNLGLQLLVDRAVNQSHHENTAIGKASSVFVPLFIPLFIKYLWGAGSVLGQAVPLCKTDREAKTNT